MGHKVSFINISNDDYRNLSEKDSYTFYKCYDTNQCFLGEEEITNQEVNDDIINLRKEIELTQDILQWNEMIKPYCIDLTTLKIKDIIDSGEADNYWSIGDKVAIRLDGTISTYTFNNEMCYAYIIGFNHNTNRETKGKCSVTFQFGKTINGTDIAFVDPVYDGTITSACGFQMNTTDTNEHGWEYSHMRSLCINFYQLLPQEWQDNIIAVKKYTNNFGNSSYGKYVQPTEDKIFLLSEYEVSGVKKYANSYEEKYQEQYEYYINGDKNIKYKSFDNEQPTAWWLRSPYYKNNYSFCYVTETGMISRGNANISYGFAPAFVVL